MTNALINRAKRTTFDIFLHTSCSSSVLFLLYSLRKSRKIRRKFSASHISRWQYNAQSERYCLCFASLTPLSVTVSGLARRAGVDNPLSLKQLLEQNGEDGKREGGGITIAVVISRFIFFS